jgi:hypothetical protein
MSKIKFILLLFFLLVVVLSMNVLIEPFRSSTATNRGVGIGHTYSGPLDLILNTDNTTYLNKTYSVSENSLDDIPSFF